MRPSSTSASARRLRASLASSRPSRWSPPRLRCAPSCSPSPSGVAVFAAARTRLGATSIRTNTPKNTMPRIYRTAAPSQFSIRCSLPAMSGTAAATIPQKNNTTTMCSWCSSRVSNKSCSEKKSMSFSITRNASPQNTARRTTLNQNSCGRVVSPRPPETGASFQAFSTKFRDGFVCASVAAIPPRGVNNRASVFRGAVATFDSRTNTTTYPPRGYEAASDGDPYPTHPGHPHPLFVPPSAEAQPELVDRPGVRLNGDSSRHFAVGARRRSIGPRFLIGFLSVGISHRPRRDPLALLPGQHLEPADRRECRLRVFFFQAEDGIRDDDRCRRPHPDSERTAHGCVLQRRRLEWPEPLQRPRSCLVFRTDPDELCRPRGRVRKSGRHHAELRDGDPRGGRPHAHPRSTDGPLHRGRDRHDDLVPTRRRPPQDRQLRRARRLDAVEPRRRDPARGARARRHKSARAAGQSVREGQLLHRVRLIPLARDDRGRVRPRLLRRGRGPPLGQHAARAL